MEFVSYGNGDHKLPVLKGNVEYKDKTTVIIVSNIDVATITFGIANENGSFLAYADGAITSDAVVNHGAGSKLMVRISGVSTNPVKIGLSV